MQNKLAGKRTENDVPTIFTIFGVTGDLASRKLLPALLNLYVKKQLPPRFYIVGFSRRHFSREEFRQFIREKMNVKHGQYQEEDIKHFLDHICYEQGMFDAKDAYLRLAERLRTIDDTWNQCSNKLFHLSTPPSLYESILDRLSESGLTVPCGGDLGWTRVLVEKPFGSDIETAKKLDKKLASLFKEEQIFRIDHYLAKEALQNIMTFRFNNSLFEPLWSRDHIDKVHVRLLEKIDIEGRGAFYDGLGALKDVGQNHMLQMLALVAMEKPKIMDAKLIRKERAKVFDHIRPITTKTIEKVATRGQYEGYTNQNGVKTNSETETYFRIEAHIDNPRWKGVPFFLESGKALFESRAEINIYFRGDSKNGTKEVEKQNVLTFKIQPDEGIKIRFWVKAPGIENRVEPKTLKFHYSDVASFDSLPDAYERVLQDAINGDQTLFTSTDEVMAAWHFITPIVKAWGKVPLTIYKRGAKEV